MRKTLFAIMATLIMLASTGISTKASGTMANPEPPLLPQNPQEDILYRLPDCDPLKATLNQPCYIEIFSNKEDINLPQSQKGEITPAMTTRCGVNVSNHQGTLLAKLWQDIRVAWEKGEDYWWRPIVYWTSRGTWTINWTYTWNPLTGPYFAGSTEYTTSNNTDGRLRLLGVPYGWHRASTRLWTYIDPYRWDCNGSY